MAAKGIQFPWRSDGGTISTNLDVIWGMSDGMSNELAEELRKRGRPPLDEMINRELATRLVKLQGQLTRKDILARGRYLRLNYLILGP